MMAPVRGATSDGPDVRFSSAVIAYYPSPWLREALVELQVALPGGGPMRLDFWVFVPVHERGSEARHRAGIRAARAVLTKHLGGASYIGEIIGGDVRIQIGIIPPDPGKDELSVFDGGVRTKTYVYLGEGCYRATRPLPDMPPLTA